MNYFHLYKRATITACFLISFLASANAQTDTATTPKKTTEDEDFSMYDEVGFVDQSAKRYCSPKIEGLSPAKLISLGFDFQGPYKMTLDTFNNNINQGSPENGISTVTSGARFSCNIPVVSKTSLVWQMGANYWESGYNITNQTTAASGYVENPMLKSLQSNGLRTMGVNTTLFKPLNDKNFLLFQGSADMSGDYDWNLMPAKFMKYSAALIYGKRPSEKKQWGLGLSRTYRAGELNYIPILLFNYTDAANKWGTEILFPARAHVRRTINSRNMIFAGYELEGQSYRLYRMESIRNQDLEIRRAEIRLRLVYEFSLKDFLWMSIQAGYRINYRYDVDRLNNGEEIFRAFGLLSKEPYIMKNTLTNPFYFNISLNLVSP